MRSSATTAWGTLARRSLTWVLLSAAAAALPGCGGAEEPAVSEEAESLAPHIAWDHRVYRRHDLDAVARPPGPELDKGTFPGYAPGIGHPVAWAWKPEDHPEWEVWVLFRVGQPNGFQRHGSGGTALPDSYLTLAHQDLDRYGDGLPMPDKTGPGAFRDHVRGEYPNEVDDVDVTDADFTVHILYTGTDYVGDGVGSFQPGLYKVWQTNHDPYVGPPVAWVWQPDGVSRNIWLVYEKDTQWGYHLPGKRSPTNAEHYTPAAFRFEYHEDVLDPSLLATDYAAAIDAFRDWIMNEPTNDVVDPGQILPVEYDHRILKWPSSD